MSIQVNDFQWEPGKNDAEYIKLLESSRDKWQKIAQKAIKAITKLKTLLRAHEPRVVTLEEIKALPDYVFLEDRDISHAFSIKTISRPALPQLVFVNTSGEECMGFRGGRMVTPV